jgi:tetratricopeptide (TPR) repeat protein
MKYRRELVLLLVVVTLLVGCSRSSMRIRTYKKDKNRKENLQATKDSLAKPPEPKKDTLSKEVTLLKAEQYSFLTNLIINNMVRAQQAAYDGRYAEAEKLLLQTLRWYPTPDALMLLGSVYEVQGSPARADSCWLEAKKMDPRFESRTSELPRQAPTVIIPRQGDF